MRSGLFVIGGVLFDYSQGFVWLIAGMCVIGGVLFD